MPKIGTVPLENKLLQQIAQMDSKKKKLHRKELEGLVKLARTNGAETMASKMMISEFVADKQAKGLTTGKTDELFKELVKGKANYPSAKADRESIDGGP
jgi:hypothetical protein